VVHPVERHINLMPLSRTHTTNYPKRSLSLTQHIHSLAAASR
jgi:hypothetical protein